MGLLMENVHNVTKQLDALLHLHERFIDSFHLSTNWVIKILQLAQQQT